MTYLLLLSTISRLAHLKHKILISLDYNSDASELLKDVKNILNISHTKFFTGIPLANYLEGRFALVSGGYKKKAKPNNTAANIDFEIALEEEAEKLGMHFSMRKKGIDETALGALSSVADLLIIDRKVLSNYCGQDIIADLVKAVTCPVLILPAQRKVESLLMVHDGSLSSVQAVKHFISIFNQNLRELPVSVLLSDPQSKKDIESEKIFVDYVKLFFANIGIQLMTDEPINCIVKSIKNTTSNPMIVVGKIGGNDILNCNDETRIITDSAPTFIFKNSSV